MRAATHLTGLKVKIFAGFPPFGHESSDTFNRAKGVLFAGFPQEKKQSNGKKMKNSAGFTSLGMRAATQSTGLKVKVM